MESNECHEKAEAQRRFLEEGTRSYLDAVGALIAYRHEVQRICKAVFGRHLDEYSSALKVEKGAVVDAEDPPLREWDGRCWCLGAKIAQKEAAPATRSWETWCHLRYESNEIGLSCRILGWFPTQQMAAKLFQRFHELNTEVEHDDRQVWIQHRLKVEEVCHLDSHLEAIIRRWIDLWKNVGGIEKVLGT